MKHTREWRGLKLRGAYGRKTDMHDWRAGKDFKIVNGPYCSRRDIDAMRAEGFDMLEFCRADGTLVERIILNPDLEALIETTGGEFARVD